MLDSQQRLEEAEAEEMQRRRSAIYKHTTGQGTCPVCQSGNVQDRLVPASLLESWGNTLKHKIDPALWPPMKPGKTPGFQCQACGHQWKQRGAVGKR